ncbi:hypothetical protein Mapa_016495 [Marchantia paleacea]|nr:hypothetical protein Mapa_016495 [Marchantia paleacea]
MKTKTAILISCLVILATATFVAAASYTHECVNETDYPVSISLKAAVGLKLSVSSVFKIAAHKVYTVFYTVTGLINSVLGLTWKITCVIGGVVHSIDVKVPFNASVKIYATVSGDIAVAVNGANKGYLTQYYSKVKKKVKWCNVKPVRRPGDKYFRRGRD